MRSALNDAGVRPAGGIGPEPNWLVDGSRANDSITS